MNNIKARFAAIGLVLYDLNRVLSNLHIGTGNTTPPQSDLQTNWTPETPQNITTLQMQAHAVTQSLNRGSHSPPSSAERAIAQLVKGCQMAMHSALILAHENERLMAANKKQKQKRAKKRAFIATGGILTVAEGLHLTEQVHRAMEGSTEQSSQRAPPKCSLCSSLFHKSNKCPQHKET